jgi:D-glycero-alpha-D-manno-heptose 1-phosphate guanylyltransferase
MECIVLAGGLGTRLQSVIGAYPKCMAPVAGQPFLAFLFRYLEQQHCTRVILSLGFKSEIVLDWIASLASPPVFKIDHVTEHEPLGTGGGIQLAMQKATNKHVAVINGDTMFAVNLTDLFRFHETLGAGTTLGLKYMEHFDRYGSVTTNSDLIISFDEKRYTENGFINGGVYAVDKEYFLSKHLPEKFSFEKDYLERFLKEERFFGFRSDAYFIDIGIPADYEKANEDFKTLL